MYQSADGMHYIRKEMVESLNRKGIISSNVLEAMYQVPRHLFVSEALRYSAYNDSSLPIGFGQTISKPSVIGLMVQSLSLTGIERVLEVGTGSGYQTAVLSRLAGSVITLERIRELSMRARTVLSGMDCRNVSFLHSDDFNEAEGTFDAVIVAAGADLFPHDILAKVHEGGRVIIPVGNGSGHRIMKYIRRNDGSFAEEHIGQATFVPLVMS
ncbi:MAG: protein-L-isoaspartate(D-aspartate) O-methyltransferase [Spirochaetae bacterium HGW-Spirochaetae-1]|nr:MAG: protein-L-isoaspartate(D-aspartate) O-methyltransferase [Spirochaetae bacterium HGW-Spirochaetae-1]